MRRKNIPAAGWVAVALGVIVVATVAFLAWFDWNALRAPIARLIANRIERPVGLQHLDVKLLAVHPRIEIEGFVIGNPRWAGEDPMIDIGRMTVQVKRWPLLLGNVAIVRAEIDKPVVRLV